MKSLLKSIFIFVCLQLGSVCSDDQNLKELCSQKFFDRITTEQTSLESTQKMFSLYRSLGNDSEYHLWNVTAVNDSEKSSDNTISLRPLNITYGFESK